MNEHTPEPWIVAKRSAGTHTFWRPGFEFPFASLVQYTHLGMRGSCGDDVDANANLFFAAPYLLEACKQLVDVWNEKGSEAHITYTPDDLDAAVGMARAAIAKAKGESGGA